MPPHPPRSPAADPDRLRHAEAALKRFGYSRVAPTAVRDARQPEFWVQEAGVPRRRFPVFVGTPARPPSTPPSADPLALPARAILVLPSDAAAEAAWADARRHTRNPLEVELAMLIVPNRPGTETAAHWHTVRLEPREVLRLATGVVVGLFRRAASEEGAGPIDFGEMLRLLRQRFMIDVRRSLGVEDDEDALFVLYQLAQRYSWAPGDGGANLHAIVLKPTGPAARLPWFAA